MQVVSRSVLHDVVVRLCSVARPQPASKRYLQIANFFALLLSLIFLGGCAGGFQGYRPVAPTVSQPASITVPVGQTATFSISATGTGPLTYQWFKNGVAIPGATSSSYTTPATVASDTGFCLHCNGLEFRRLGHQRPRNSDRPTSSSTGQEHLP